MQIFNTALGYPVRPSDRRLSKTKKCYRTDRYDASNLPLSELQPVQTKVITPSFRGHSIGHHVYRATVCRMGRYESNRAEGGNATHPCWQSSNSFSSASCIRSSTSFAERLKFGIANAKTVTHRTPSLKHISSI